MPNMIAKKRFCMIIFPNSIIDMKNISAYQSVALIQLYIINCHLSPTSIEKIVTNDQSKLSKFSLGI